MKLNQDTNEKTLSLINLNALKATEKIKQISANSELNSTFTKVTLNIKDEYYAEGKNLLPMFDSLAEFLSKQLNITTLSIRIFPNVIIGTENFFNALNSHPNIKNVIFENVTLKDGVITINNSSIERLEILDEQFNRHPYIKLLAFQNLNLKYLHVGGCFSHDNIAFIKEIKPNLKFECKFLGDTLMINEPILDLVKSTYQEVNANAWNEKITCVIMDYSKNNLTSMGNISIFAKHFADKHKFKNLKSIILKNFHEHYTQIGTILQNMKNHPLVKTLVIDKCCINNIESDLDIFRSNVINFSYVNNNLNINYNHLKSLLCQNPHLKFINLSNNDDCGYNGYDAKHIIKIMEEHKICVIIPNTKTKYFNYSYNPITKYADSKEDSYDTVYVKLFKNNFTTCLKHTLYKEIKTFLMCLKNFHATNKILVPKFLKMKIIDEMLGSNHEYFLKKEHLFFDTTYVKDILGDESHSTNIEDN